MFFLTPRSSNFGFLGTALWCSWLAVTAGCAKRVVEPNVALDLDALREAQAQARAGGELPAASPEELERIQNLYNQAIEFFEQFGQAGENFGGDCPRLATEWKALMDKNRLTLEELQKAEDTLPDADKERMAEAQADKLAAVADKITKAMELCRDNAELKELLETGEFP